MLLQQWIFVGMLAAFDCLVYLSPNLDIGPELGFRLKAHGRLRVELGFGSALISRV